MPEDPLLPPPRPAGLEELHAGLHDVLRLIEIEHALLKGRLESLRADTEGGTPAGRGDGARGRAAAADGRSAPALPRGRKAVTELFVGHSAS